MPTESKTSARKLTARERENRALELRMTAATYSQIGQALGISEAGAYKAVIRALGKLNAKVMENAEELRTLEVQRLDSLFITMYAQAKSGHQGAVDRCLRIMERRAKLLGLDAPTKQDITSDGKKLEILFVNDWRNPEQDEDAE